MTTKPDPQPPPARILAIASEHVRRLGPSRMTVVAVAEQAGMTHANVYRYFPSKAALLEAVTADWLRELYEAMAASADAPDPADDKLERMVLEIARRYRDKLERDPKIFEVLVSEFESNSATARKHRARLRALIERVVEEGLSSGIFVKDRMRAVHLVFDMPFRFIHPAAVRLDREVPRAELQARLERVIRGLLASLRTI